MASSEKPAALPAPAAQGRKSMLQWIAVMLLLTLIAGATGGGLGLQLVSKVEDALKSEEKPEPETISPVYTGHSHLTPLAPIITNLAAPNDTWIRIEASIVFVDEDTAADEILAAEISEDLLAYLRSVTLAQIDGPSGISNLRNDLTEYVVTRSGGRAQELVVHSLIVQ
jgi:flagellar FliL protein